MRVRYMPGEKGGQLVQCEGRVHAWRGRGAASLSSVGVRYMFSHAMKAKLMYF